MTKITLVLSLDSILFSLVFHSTPYNLLQLPSTSGPKIKKRLFDLGRNRFSRGFFIWRFFKFVIYGDFVKANFLFSTVCVRFFSWSFFFLCSSNFFISCLIYVLLVYLFESREFVGFSSSSFSPCQDSILCISLCSILCQIVFKKTGNFAALGTLREENCPWR